MGFSLRVSMVWSSRAVASNPLPRTQAGPFSPERRPLGAAARPGARSRGPAPAPAPAAGAATGARAPRAGARVLQAPAPEGGLGIDSLPDADADTARHPAASPSICRPKVSCTTLFATGDLFAR
jgi:hypothetical protein